MANNNLYISSNDYRYGFTMDGGYWKIDGVKHNSGSVRVQHGSTIEFVPPEGKRYSAVEVFRKGGYPKRTFTNTNPNSASFTITVTPENSASDFVDYWYARTVNFVPTATKAPFTIPSNVATNVRNQNTDILVNNVVKTGAVTVGIDETLKLKPHENYEINFAVIVFNDATQPNGLSEFPMTISDNEATFKNDKLSSDWTFNSIVYSASYVEPTKAPFTIPSNVATNVRNQNTDILVNDVIKTGEVTVGIDETLKLKPHENYVIDWAFITFNDDTQPNGLSEFPMTISDNEATFKNDKISSKWTFNGIVYSTHYEAPPLPEPDEFQWLITPEMITKINNANGKLYYDGSLVTDRLIIDRNKDLEVKPNSGYVFSDGSYVSAVYSGVFGNENRSFTIVNENLAKLSLDGSYMQNTDLITFNLLINEYVEPEPENELASFTISGNESISIRNKAKIYVDDVEDTAGPITVGINQTLKFVANSGYIITEAELNFDEETFDFVIDEDTATFKNDKPTSLYTIPPIEFVTLVTVKEEYRIPFSQEDIDRVQDNHATLYIDDEIVTEPTLAFQGQEIKLVADEGWEFYDRPGDSTSARLRFTTIMGDWLYIPFELSPMRKEATTTVNDARYMGYGFDRLFVETTQSKIDVSGTNNVYEVDDSIIRGLNNERYRTRIVRGDERAEIEFFDYGDFIINVLELPFKLDESMILDNESINLGDRTINTSAAVVATDNVEIDMGSITIEGDGNSLDYQQVNAVLHLPALPKMIVDISYVMNQTLSIKYHVDMYTSDTVVNLYSTAVDNGEKPFLSTSGSIGTVIPFAGYKFYINTPQNKGINTSAVNDLTHAYIEIIKNDAPFKDDFFSASVSDAGTLENESGYIEVDNARLDFKALQSEKEDIINIIRSGIIV